MLLRNRNVGPDDIEAAFGAAEDDVHQVGFWAGPAAGAWALWVATEDEDHDVDLFAFAVWTVLADGRPHEQQRAVRVLGHRVVVSGVDMRPRVAPAVPGDAHIAAPGFGRRREQFEILIGQRFQGGLLFSSLRGRRVRRCLTMSNMS